MRVIIILLTLLLFMMYPAEEVLSPANPKESPSKVTLPSRMEESPLPPHHAEVIEEEYLITAYTDGPESTGKSPGDPGYGITASGTVATEGRTIACPPSLLFGTRLYIPGIGTRTCEDRGGAIQGNHVDVFMKDLHKALLYGKQIEMVTIERGKNTWQ